MPRNSEYDFASTGGKPEATLRGDHVARDAGEPEAKAAYSVVVGQIHAVKYKSTSSGFGYSNEPVKIYYKKYPGHESGLVFGNYERSLISGADAKHNLYAYGGDSLYFKAGVYNQCSTQTGGGNWYAACAGTGDWEIDKANGDYAQATFSRIELSESTPPE